MRRSIFGQGEKQERGSLAYIWGPSSPCLAPVCPHLLKMGGHLKEMIPTEPTRAKTETKTKFSRSFLHKLAWEIKLHLW